MARPMRRVVTGHNAQGKSIFLTDGPSSHVLELEAVPGLALIDLWVTDRAPAGGNVGPADPAARPVVLGADHVMDPSAARHPAMHKTSTVDYALVVDGEIWALMDEGERLLRAGDCLIQRGTNHAWSNRSDRPCRVAFVLVSAEPV